MVYCNLKEMSPQRKGSCDETPLNSYIDTCVNNMHLFDSFSKKKSEQGMLETSSDDHDTSNQFQNNISCKIENDAYPSEQTNNGELDEIQSETDEKYPVLGINFVPKTSNLWDPLVQSAEQDQVKVEDVYTTDSSIPSLEISSNDPYKVEAKVELFTEDVVLDEPDKKVAEYNHSIHSTNSPQEITFVSTDGLHNVEVKLEQFSEEENSNSDPCSAEEPPEQHFEEVTLPKLEYSDEDPGYSKHQENSSQGAITPSAKKAKHLPSVKKSTQNTGNISKEVKVLLRNSFPYCCDICGAMFSCQSEWTRHQQEHSKPFHCQAYDKQFASKRRRKKGPYKCRICGARFKHMYYKRAHERAHVQRPCFECPDCGKMFSYKNSLAAHLRVHSGVKPMKPFSCQTCSKRFVKKYLLNQHQLTHSEERPFKCRICNHQFKHYRHVALHERIHVEGPRYECAHCGKKYRQKTSLAKHIFSKCMRESLPYSCDICGTEFYYKHDWTKHQRQEHTKPYHCQLCDKQFAYKSESVTHRLTHSKRKRYWAMHLQSELPKPFHCQACDEQFAYRSDFTAHRLAHSENKDYKCRICDAGFKSNRNKLKHERVHMEGACFECADCGKKFSYKENLIKHLRLHSNVKSFSCQTCGKSFAQKGYLTRHQRTHSKEKSFKCRMCNQQFSHQGDKARHERFHVEGPCFECAHCGNTYRRKNNLAKHILSSNGCGPKQGLVQPVQPQEKMDCKICPQRFRTKLDLDSHVYQEHATNVSKTTAEGNLYKQCYLCSQLAASMRAYHFHFINKHPNDATPLVGLWRPALEKDWKVCHICKQVFDTSRKKQTHLRTAHTLLETHNCCFCNARYDNRGSLGHHERTIHRNKAELEALETREELNTKEKSEQPLRI
ncbi:zinc finger protein 184-like [Planococcus citri]|uniref:zinc finger protein 184-like n=1 Tax=Planococcus citri TaxID=170843 RepID=UPI0031F723D2